MEGDVHRRTPKTGRVMSSNHQMEARDAKHKRRKANPADSNPPAAKGGRPPARKPAGELIAQSSRPSFFQLLTALWGAEDEIEQTREDKEGKQKRPRRRNLNQKERP